MSEAMKSFFWNQHCLGQYSSFEQPVKTLLAQVHKRVRLAIRLDEVQRIQTKEKAEQTWRQRTADEVPFTITCTFIVSDAIL